MKTFHLYKDIDKQDYYLLCHQRQEISNSNENSLSEVLKIEDASILIRLSRFSTNFEKIGLMEDFPIGDGLFEINDKDKVCIWYSHNLLNSSFLILGTAPSAQEFHDEAIEEYPGMVTSLHNHKKINVVFLNAK